MKEYQIHYRTAGRNYEEVGLKNIAPEWRVLSNPNGRQLFSEESALDIKDAFNKAGIRCYTSEVIF